MVGSERCPRFTTYTIVEFRRVNPARKAFFDLRFDDTIRVSAFLLPLVDLLLRSPMEYAENLAGQLLEAIEKNDEELTDFAKCYPEELKRLRALLPRSIEITEQKFTDKEVLDAFGRATEAIPRLPTNLAKWNSDAPSRSMLSPVGDGL